MRRRSFTILTQQAVIAGYWFNDELVVPCLVVCCATRRTDPTHFVPVMSFRKETCFSHALLFEPYGPLASPAWSQTAPDTTES
jgi:hypothetical protein